VTFTAISNRRGGLLVTRPCRLRYWPFEHRTSRCLHLFSVSVSHPCGTCAPPD